MSRVPRSSPYFFLPAPGVYEEIRPEVIQQKLNQLIFLCQDRQYYLSNQLEIRELTEDELEEYEELHALKDNLCERAWDHSSTYRKESVGLMNLLESKSDIINNVDDLKVLIKADTEAKDATVDMQIKLDKHQFFYKDLPRYFLIFGIAYLGVYSSFVWHSKDLASVLFAIVAGALGLDPNVRNRLDKHE